MIFKSSKQIFGEEKKCRKLTPHLFTFWKFYSSTLRSARFCFIIFLSTDIFPFSIADKIPSVHTNSSRIQSIKKKGYFGVYMYNKYFV